MSIPGVTYLFSRIDDINMKNLCIAGYVTA